MLIASRSRVRQKVNRRELKITLVELEPHQSSVLVCRATPVKRQDEGEQQFNKRVRTEGPAQFQAAMWQVHAVFERMPSWATWTAEQQKLGMRVCITPGGGAAQSVPFIC
jgi:hypothetical protein